MLILLASLDAHHSGNIHRHKRSTKCRDLRSSIRCPSCCCSTPATPPTGSIQVYHCAGVQDLRYSSIWYTFKFICLTHCLGAHGAAASEHQGVIKGEASRRLQDP